MFVLTRVCMYCVVFADDCENRQGKDGGIREALYATRMEETGEYRARVCDTGELSRWT